MRSGVKKALETPCIIGRSAAAGSNFLELYFPAYIYKRPRLPVSAFREFNCLVFVPACYILCFDIIYSQPVEKSSLKYIYSAMSLSSVLRPKVLRSLKSVLGLHQCNQSYHMSVVPYLVREMLQELERPRLYDQHFGLGLNPAHLIPHDLLRPLSNSYLRPWRLLDQMDSGVSNIVNDKDGFKVILDVQQFKPDELTVKVADNFVVVEGKHEERSDEHGFISRQFTRRYRLPENIDVQALQSSLSSDGVLQLTAPKKAIAEANERSIPITHTNTPAVKATQPNQKKEEAQNESK